MITQEANLGSKADKMRRVWEPTYIVVYREAREDGERPGSRRGSNLPQLPITANTQCSMDEVLQLIRQLYKHERVKVRTSDTSWEPGMYECLNVLNNFCFHVYAQTYSHTFSLSLFLTLTLSHSHSFSLSLFLFLTLSHSHTLSISHSITLDMLNKFCFHLFAQKSLFIGENCKWSLV